MKTNQTKKLVLSDGETIGHKHVLESMSAFTFTRTDNNIRFILTDTGILTHDEHDRMIFHRGAFRSYHQVEFNPMDNSVNQIFD